jgi:hypothetical protein
MFKLEEKYEHKLYREIRDCRQRNNTRNQMQRFWAIYKDYAPKNFLDHLQYEVYFKHRWWEMFLGVGLIDLGFKIETSDKDYGPDFVINNPTSSINIEAIAPKMGNSCDQLPNMQFGVTDLVPIKDKYLLRLRSAIKEKNEKYKKYIEDGTVQEDDINIIAVSSCSLSQYGSLMDYPVPAIVCILKDIGDLYIDIETQKSGFIKKSGVAKTNGVSISTDVFAQMEYSDISAVLYSNTGVLNSPDKPEVSFVMVLNQNAKNKINQD